MNQQSENNNKTTSEKFFFREILTTHVFTHVFVFEYVQKKSFFFALSSSCVYQDTSLVHNELMAWLWRTKRNYVPASESLICTITSHVCTTVTGKVEHVCVWIDQQGCSWRVWSNTSFTGLSSGALQSRRHQPQRAADFEWFSPWLLHCR